MAASCKGTIRQKETFHDGFKTPMNVCDDEVSSRGKIHSSDIPQSNGPYFGGFRLQISRTNEDRFHSKNTSTSLRKSHVNTYP